MTTEEFSNEFDVLVNSYSTQESFGLNQSPLSFNEYEKSIFLTKAQEDTVEGLYTGKLLGNSFEQTEQLRRYLSQLTKTVTLPCRTNPNSLSDNSVFATIPEDVWFITYESVTLQSDSPCINNKEIQVVPVTQDEYHRIKQNPFRRPNSRRAIRLDVSDSMVELISSESIKSYLLRYIVRPEPIILIDLPEELSINNTKTKTECKLNPGIHRMILEMAVSIAIKSRIPSTGN